MSIFICSAFTQRFGVSLILILFSFVAGAQFTITGIVKNADGKPLSNASVVIDSIKYIGSTNPSGTFEFNSVPAGSYMLNVTYLGFKKYTSHIVLKSDTSIVVILKMLIVEQQEILINATRVKTKDGFTFTDIDKETLKKNNTGRDLPYLLQLTPSLVVTSDAGAGVGYTGVRIRGSDASRINVTLNGVPVNDAESQNVYFVDIPDLASSVENIQVQRGVGTSSNGTGSFGGAINIMTNRLSEKQFVTSSNAIGSFNTIKNNLSVGSGLLNDHFEFEGRISRIKSSGYIDRASSDLKSYFISGGYFGKRIFIKFTLLSGKEITYQAWNGVPEYLLNTDRTYNAFSYQNQVDNYNQVHYQLQSGYDISKNLHLQLTLHDTKGKGYYEEYKNADDLFGEGLLSSYGLPDIYAGGDTITATDLVRRKWLNNNFYGSTFALLYDAGSAFKATVGGAWNQYNGSHFSELYWMRYAGNTYPGYRYENDNALKTDFNVYIKGYYQIFKRLYINAEMQMRNVNYHFNGFDENALVIPQRVNLLFYNPKAAVNLMLGEKTNWYASVSRGSQEPSRDDFTETTTGSRPLPEKMTDVESGLRFNNKNISATVNYYMMNYNNQLVLTGKINDVGNYTRINVPHSYRQGIEADVSYSPVKFITVKANATISENKIKAFDEYIDNYDDGSQLLISHHKTSLAFSPDFISAGMVTVSPFKNFSLSMIIKYVGRQYLDNTSENSRIIKDYTVCDAHLDYSLHLKALKEIQFSIVASNLLSKKYNSNGYTFSYISDGNFTTENYFYPQALINFMGQVTVKF